MMTGVSLARIAAISSEPMPGMRKNLFGDDGAAEHGGHLAKAPPAYHRNQRVANHVLD